MGDQEDRPGAVSITLEDGIATLVLDSPRRRNAISMSMWQQIGAFARESLTRSDIRAVIVRGNGTAAFSAGADISDFASARSSEANARAYDDLVEETCRAVEAMRCPTIALIHGACIGAGASLASSCDLRVASHGGYFQVPAARLGLGYDPRGIARFLRVMGNSETRMLLLTAQRLPVERAAQLGAVHEVGTIAEAGAAALRLAGACAANAPLTQAAAKAALKAHATRDDSEMAHAMRLYEEADASEDYKEGRRAFAEKRPPRFTGK